MAVVDCNSDADNWPVCMKLTRLLYLALRAKDWMPGFCLWGFEKKYVPIYRPVVRSHSSDSTWCFGRHTYPIMFVPCVVMIRCSTSVSIPILDGSYSTGFEYGHVRTNLSQASWAGEKASPGHYKKAMADGACNNHGGCLNLEVS